MLDSILAVRYDREVRAITTNLMKTFYKVDWTNDKGENRSQTVLLEGAQNQLAWAKEYAANIQRNWGYNAKVVNA